MEKSFSLSLGFEVALLTLAGYVLDQKHLCRLMNIDETHSAIRTPLVLALLYAGSEASVRTTRKILLGTGVFYLLVGSAGLLDRRLGSRQDVGQIQKAFVGWLLRNFFGHEVGVRHAQIFGLPTRHVAIEFGVAEHGRTAVVFSDLRGFTLCRQSFFTHRASSAGDIERYVRDRRDVPPNTWSTPVSQDRLLMTNR